jgi:hypothetical protein
MNLDRIDKQAADSLFRLLGRRVRFLPINGQEKTCRAIIVKGVSAEPSGFSSQVIDSQIQISFKKRDVGRPQTGDQITINKDKFTVDRILEDDGLVVKVSVR